MTDQSPVVQQEAPGSSLRDLLQVLFKHQAKILTIFIATVVTVAVGSFYTAPVYEATASVLVKIGREYLTKPEVGDARNLMIVNQEEIINSEIQILNNRELIEKVITAMGVDTIYPRLDSSPPAGIAPLEAAVLKFSKDLKVEGVKKSNVIRISFQHRDPEVAATALAFLVDVFKAKHLEVFSNSQSSFLEKQLAEYEQRLKRSESALEAFKQENQIYSVEEQRSLLLKQRVDLDTALKATHSRVDELQKKIASYREQLPGIAQNKARYTQPDSNPVYQEVEKEMLKAETEFASQRAGAVTIARQLAQLDRTIQAVDQKQNELRNLQRELSTNEKNYLTYVEKLEQARISDELDKQNIANISVVQAPATPRKPVKPNILLNIVLSVLLGAVSGLGYAFFAEHASQSFSTPEQVERRLGLPVLASIAQKG